MKLVIKVCLALFKGWTWRMAWRDCRSHRLKMLLFTSAIMVGVGALVAIRSFSGSVAQSVTEQARALVGADLVVSAREDLPDNVEEFLKDIPGERAEQSTYITMAFFPKQKSTRLVQSRYMTGGFPWYGEITAEPAGAVQAYQKGEGVLVEKTLMTQYDLSLGDAIMVYGQSHTIVGWLLNIPGEGALVGQLAPRIVIKGERQASLFSALGSKARHQAAFKLPESTDLEALTKSLDKLRKTERFRYDTIDTRTERIGNRLSNLFSFLSLVGFVALLLGGVGVASSVHLYIRGKLPTVAMLHCVGATTGQTVAIYVLQAVMMGLGGGLLGAFLGTAVQHLIPLAFGDLFPFTVALSLDWVSIGLGLFIGLACTFLFSLLPLMGVRRVSPLMTLRADLEPELRKDPVRWLVYLLLIAGVAAFAIFNTPKVVYGLAFTTALVVAMLILYAVATLLMVLLKRAPVSWMPFHFRQGIKNVYRPGNQTRTLVLCVGIGVFLIMSQYLADEQLVRQVKMADASNKPNLVLFEVRKDQVDGIKELLAKHKLPVVGEEPVVSMKLASVKGVPVEDLMEKAEKRPPGKRGRWVYRRTYRVTSRDRLNDGEKIVSGQFPSSREKLEGTKAQRHKGTKRKTDEVTKNEDGVTPDPAPRSPQPASLPLPISIEVDLARRLGVTLNDTLEFECDGKVLKTVVGSLREVDWFRMQPSFFIVFPGGTLDEMSQITAIVSRSSTQEQANAFQLESVKAFPNVWVIDLATVIDTFSSIQKKMAFTVRFMALFSVATGLMVLISTVHNSRDQRLRENTLLRTLGAKGKAVLFIMTTEYLMLGGLSALAGNVMAVLSSWAVTRFVFKIDYHFDWQAIVISTAAIVGVTLVVGLLNTAASNRRAPLEVLREIA